MRQEVLWSPRANPGVTVLAALPNVLRDRPCASIGAIGDAPDHWHGNNPTSAEQGPPFLLLPGIEPGAPVAALIQLDDDIPGRIEALIPCDWVVNRTPSTQNDTVVALQSMR